ncbi:hypothetical protein PAPYR_2163 [Paratrimastix pyriformis]|uniref:Uncharacterized protein n=1 Tax=Paratrimastix pyriformis TaxID=342808 RepID=A0ABQ8UUZ0_9EUKA|nr:hypothetical protein PAPYR_2163 [Paratrimastix pyriformis]
MISQGVDPIPSTSPPPTAPVGVPQEVAPGWTGESPAEKQIDRLLEAGCLERAAELSDAIATQRVCRDLEKGRAAREYLEQKKKKPTKPRPYWGFQVKRRTEGKSSYVSFLHEHPARQYVWLTAQTGYRSSPLYGQPFFASSRTPGSWGYQCSEANRLVIDAIFGDNIFMVSLLIFQYATQDLRDGGIQEIWGCQLWGKRGLASDEGAEDILLEFEQDMHTNITALVPATLDKMEGFTGLKAYLAAHSESRDLTVVEWPRDDAILLKEGKVALEVTPTTTQEAILEFVDKKE